MPARFWDIRSESHLKKCSEFVSPACDPIPTDGCCAVIPCTYCLIWTVYGEDDQFGSASFDIDGWYGTIAGAAFRGYWERNYETDECEFVVTLDDEEIYRNDCYGGQSCRDSSDSAEATIYPDSGTLTWTKVEPRPLEYVIDEETNCRTHFCGACECSCDCLCVRIITGSDPDLGAGYGGDIYEGAICDVSYPCDGPLWEGTVGDYELSLALDRDMYGECIIVPTVNGVELDAVAADGCGAMSAVITLDDGTTISVRCKECGCTEGAGGQCCEDRVSPIPYTLYATAEVSTDCTNVPVGTVITLENCGTPEAMVDTWAGSIDTGFAIVWFAITCESPDGGLTHNWYCTSATEPCDVQIPTNTQMTTISCDPLELLGTMDPQGGCDGGITGVVTWRVTE